MRPARARCAAAGAALVLLGVLLAGCGVGLDTAPNVVSTKDVPFGLLKPAPPTTTTPDVRQFATIYLAGPSRLVAASRGVPAPPTLRGILDALGEGPTSAQAARGLESPISTAAPLTLVREVGGTVTVGVAATFTKLAEPDQAVAVAQLVYTLTAFPTVSAVDVRIGDKAAKVPTAKGTLSHGPLVRTDYVTLAPI
jgi:hypothetical protein